MKNRFSNRLAVAIIALAAASAGVIGSMLVAAQSGDEDRQDPVGPDQVTPPPYNSLIRPDNGRFETLLWDDRPISDEAKAAQPWYDPRWRSFSHCMIDEGFDVRDDPTKPFSQADLDEIVARTNAERPDGEANKQIGGNVAEVPGIAGAFLRCGHWITLPRSEWLANGIVKTEPGEIPEP